MEEFNKILKFPMFDAMVAPMHDKQPGLVATGCRYLGDQFRRQVKMKVGGSHGGKIAVRRENGQFTI